MRRLLLTIAVAGLLSAATLGDDEPGKTDKDEIQDTWAIVAIETNGEKRDTRELAKAGAARIVITADNLALPIELLTDEEDATYKIEPGKRPRAIDVTFTKGNLKGKTWQGIYSLRRDKLKMCFDRSGKGRPKAFVTKKEDGLTLYYLERE